jgi:acyl carrier protein
MDRRQRIRQFVLTNFLFTDDDGALADDTQLIQDGIVDSTGILELIMFLEETWSIKVPAEDMTPAHFGSVAAVDAYLERRVAA